MKTRHVCVVGAGVVGLSSAVCIQEQLPDVHVTLVADKFSPHTTSDGSGGFWCPHDLGNTPEALIRKWGKETLDYILSLIKSSDAAVVQAQMLSGYMMSSSVQEEPDYKDLCFGYRLMTSEELKDFPNMKWGYFYTTVQIDVKPYMQWLMRRFKERGGRVEVQTVSSIDQLSKHCDVIVNCCGLRGGILGCDKEVYPIRGQVMRVVAPWIKHFYICLDEGSETYFIPGTTNIVIGGTEQVNRWDEEVDENDHQRIWKRAVRCIPSIQHAKIVTRWVGLRPARSTVRLEAERKNNSVWIVHNYGHGGSGVTLHWGCAQHAASLVGDCLRKLESTSRL
ncbi:D-aspartate oxidase-like [Gigantopelta aegis]|uniref:D-aspartate oxidase-like n=1 Tax=Gigantopelta aegis TaxID=1735272 RepID=UPI001B88E20B|nr:D-aspartate oxidase-like [Gigantopelta aegis]